MFAFHARCVGRTCNPRSRSCKEPSSDFEALQQTPTLAEHAHGVDATEDAVVRGESKDRVRSRPSVEDPRAPASLPNLVAMTHAAIADLQPQQRIDVQSVIWVVRRYQDQQPSTA